MHRYQISVTLVLKRLLSPRCKSQTVISIQANGETTLCHRYPKPSYSVWEEIRRERKAAPVAVWIQILR